MQLDLSAPEIADLALSLTLAHPGGIVGRRADLYAKLRTAVSQEICKGWEDRAYHGLFCPWCGTKVACQERKTEPESCPCCGFRPGEETNEVL